MNPTITFKYRPDIDGLRALAVLLVVGYHAFPTVVPGGFIGVDIFFVISGFLISNIIFNGILEKNFSSMHFYSRRMQLSELPFDSFRQKRSSHDESKNREKWHIQSGLVFLMVAKNHNACHQHKINHY